MKSVFITGVGGFLGGYMARHFTSLGCRVSGTDSSPAEAVADLGLSAFFSGVLPDGRLVDWLGEVSPDLVIHCAGSASVPLSMENPAADFERNTRVTFELLESCRRLGFGGGVLLMSSAAVYGNPESIPVDEDAPIAPVSAYGFHKRQAELQCEEYARLFGVRTASLRIFSAYGPGLRRQVFWDLARKIHGEGPLELQGTGAETRDFIHAGDVARAAEAIALRGEMAGECYNVASGEELAIAALAERLCEAFGVKKEIAFSGVLPSGVPCRWCADTSRLRGLGFAPTIDLTTGIPAFAEWARSHVDALR